VTSNTKLKTVARVKTLIIVPGRFVGSLSITVEGKRIDWGGGGGESRAKPPDTHITPKIFPASEAGSQRRHKREKTVELIGGVKGSGKKGHSLFEPSTEVAETVERQRLPKKKAGT